MKTDLAHLIEHTLLKAAATKQEVKHLCAEAKTWRFAGVCVNSYHIELVAEELEGTDIKPVCVIGFPLGANTTATKVFETVEAIKHGAREIDMVLNIGALKAQDYGMVQKDIEQIVAASKGAPVKVILETALLTHEEKIKACEIAMTAGAAFVKTSTGFGPGGATVEDVQLMRQTVGAHMGVKASGGIRTQEDAQKMVEAGANRIGASASVAMVGGG